MQSRFTNQRLLTYLLTSDVYGLVRRFSQCYGEGVRQQLDVSSPFQLTYQQFYGILHSQMFADKHKYEQHNLK